MKSILCIVVMLGLALNLSACIADDNYGGENPPPPENIDNMKLKMTIGANSYTATLYDNATANEFKAMLPMTLNMSEHNRNEKYFDLPNRLTTAASNPKTINNGDLMLFGSSTLVLFYKTFSSSYSYTKIGAIDDPSGLEAALGAGSVTVVFGQLNGAK